MTSLADELAAALAAQPRVTVDADRLAEMVVALHPEWATASDRFARLAEALDELAARGLVQPSRRRRVRQGTAVPAFVRVVANRPQRPADNPARRFPWVPEMAWVASGPRRPPAQQAQLEALSRWIAAHRDRSRPVVPVRERSLEVFGADKLLDDLVAGVLAGHPETVAALAVEPVHPPMAVAPVRGAAGRDVLVVENGTPFHSVRRAAEHHAAAGHPVRYGWVGYGAGHQLAAILPSLLALPPAGTGAPPAGTGAPPDAATVTGAAPSGPDRIGELDYFGDLDPNGLAIAAAGARRCPDAGLPALRPAHELYELLLAHGRPQPAPRPPLAWPDAGLAWLGPRLAGEVGRVLGAGHWLAQEWVGVELLRADPGWCV